MLKGCPPNEPASFWREFILPLADGFQSLKSADQRGHWHPIRFGPLAAATNILLSRCFGRQQFHRASALPVSPAREGRPSRPVGTRRAGGAHRDRCCPPVPRARPRTERRLREPTKSQRALVESTGLPMATEEEFEGALRDLYYERGLGYWANRFCQKVFEPLQTLCRGRPGGPERTAVRSGGIHFPERAWETRPFRRNSPS